MLQPQSNRSAPPGWVSHVSAGLCVGGFAALCLGLTSLVLALAVAFLAVSLCAQLRGGAPRVTLPPTSLVALAIWSLLGSALSRWPLHSLGWWAIGLAVAVSLWQVATFPWTRRHSRFLAAAVACCGAALGLWAVLQFAATRSEAAGRMTHPNRLAAFFLLVWPVAHAWGRTGSRRLLRAAGIAASSLMIAGLAVTFSRAGWLGAAAQGFYLFPRRRSRVLAAILVAVVVVWAVFPWEMGGFARTLMPAYRTNVSRLAEWGAALRLLGDEAVWGIGVGNYSRAAGTESLVPHNLFLHVAAQTGVVGLCLFVALLRNVWGGLTNRVSGDQGLWAFAARIAIVGVLAQGLFDY